MMSSDFQRIVRCGDAYLGTVCERHIHEATSINLSGPTKQLDGTSAVSEKLSHCEPSMTVLDISDLCIGSCMIERLRGLFLGVTNLLMT
jgi:hypothetical protein